MLHDPVLTEETTNDDLVLARALLVQHSPEDIAAALARLYCARLPSPEDILDPGEHSTQSREDRGRDKRSQTPRGDDDRSAKPRSKPRKRSARHGMSGGWVWFSAAIGRRKNAEARWLLPMICRRGSIEKQDVGTIRVLDTTTEFEISDRAAASFTAKVRRPDKEDNIHVEPLAHARGDHAPPDNSDGATEQRYNQPRQESRMRSARTPEFKKKNKHRNKPAHDGQPQLATAARAKRKARRG